MAGRGNGGNADLTVRILRQIRDEIHAMRQETNQRLDETNQRLGRLEGRFDHFLKTAGAEVRDLRERVGRVEHRLERLGSR